MISRREFFRKLGRLGAFAALGWLSIRLVRTTAPSGEKCAGGFICRRCGRVQSCGLPQALSFRETSPGAGYDAGKDEKR